MNWFSQLLRRLISLGSDAHRENEMSEQKAKRGFAVIGVVGRTYKKTPVKGEIPTDIADLIDAAKRLGERITECGHAVLTGGHYARPETSVKFCALEGAVKAASKVGLARLIGVVPRDITEALQLSAQEPFTDLNVEGKVRHLYLHTGLVGERRNEITGQAVDVLIALVGEKGTPQEVTAALTFGRPVVFLNSWSALKDSIPEKLHPVPPCEVKSVEEAVTQALAAIGWRSEAPRLCSSSPLLTQKFSDGLRALEVSGETANPAARTDC